MFLEKEVSEIMTSLWSEFQKNIDLYMGFGEYHSEEELLKNLEDYIFNKRYNHDTVDLVLEALSKMFQLRVFIFEESLTKSPCGIVGEKFNRCINLLKKKDHYGLIVAERNECKKFSNRSVNLLIFPIFHLLNLSYVWHFLYVYISSFLSKPRS